MRLVFGHVVQTLGRRPRPVTASSTTRMRAFTQITIVPGFTRARTRYIHVKAQAPNRGILTTQRYFAGESWNASDAIYSPELLMAIETTAGGRPATSSFVLQS